MRKIINFAFVAMVTLASAPVLADQASTDPESSKECRDAMVTAAGLATSAASYKGLVENLEPYAAEFKLSEEAYFGRFYADKVITLTGTVKEFQWTNPHTRIALTIAKDGAEAQQWAIEMNGPGGLARLGWRPKTLIAGMLITVTIHPLRDGTNGGQLLAAVLPDGRQMPGGRDRPGRLQELRDLAAAAEAAVAEFVKKQQLLGCRR